MYVNLSFTYFLQTISSLVMSKSKPYTQKPEKQYTKLLKLSLKRKIKYQQWILFRESNNK